MVTMNTDLDNKNLCTQNKATNQEMSYVMSDSDNNFADSTR